MAAAAAATEEVVVIVGAGPAGLAAAACLRRLSIQFVVLERDDCVAPTWRRRVYDRLTLHLAKCFSELPGAPHAAGAPAYLPASKFADYLDEYADRFDIRPRFGRAVESAAFDAATGKWVVTARTAPEEEEERYVCRFLVVASGENDAAHVPQIAGMGSFPGDVVHSSAFRSGVGFAGKSVLVVGSGNSGMEIAYDLATAGAKTSIIIRSPFHIMSRGVSHLAHVLGQYVPIDVVDKLVLFLCYLQYGDTTKYGIRRPRKGPMYLKKYTPVYPVLDVGTYGKIKSGEIQVLPSLEQIEGKNVKFTDGKTRQFDSIVLATGYRSKIKTWLKGDDCLIGDDGMAKQPPPNNWKGKDGLYCAGLARFGIYGLADDAQKIANDIEKILKNE